MTAPMLSVRDLAAGYGNRRVITGINFDVAEQDLVLILGHNGAGKTTLMRALFGLLRPDSGRVLFEAKEVTGQTPARSVGMKIAFVPQGHGIFSRLTVRENLALGAFSVADKAVLPQRLETIFALFPILAQRATQIGGTLSGGQQQMLAIGMALVAAPKLLILDEPSIGLAPNLVASVMASIKRINDEFKTTIIMVEQNITCSLPIARRVMILKTGSKVFEGAAGDIPDRSVLMPYF